MAYRIDLHSPRLIDSVLRMVDSLPRSDDPKLAEAIRRRDAALQEAAEWDVFIRRFTLLEGSATLAGGGQLMTRAKVVRSNAGLKKPPFGGYKTPKNKDVVKTLEAARAVILERGHPVMIGGLYDEVVARGLRIGGKKPKVNFDGRLRYSPDFTNIKGQGWWLTDRPLPVPNGSAAGISEMPAAHEVPQAAP